MFCSGYLTLLLEDIVKTVVSHVQHPRVRYAACNAIGQMATDFAPTFQKKFHDKVSHGTEMEQFLFLGGVLNRVLKST